MVGYDKRRQSQRIQPFVAPCRYVVAEERVSAFLTDISRGGGRVSAELEPPAVGTTLTIELRLARQPVALRLPATVRWTRQGERGGYVFGVSFDGVGQEEQQALDSLVEGFLRRAASII
jgi:c-di-GMP-binding flagellar brake protein YcgR